MNRRRRSTDRVGYPWEGSALGHPTNAERLAVGVAISMVGELTERERKISVELAHFFSGAIADLESTNERLNDLVLELRRLHG